MLNKPWNLYNIIKNEPNRNGDVRYLQLLPEFRAATSRETSSLGLFL